MFCADVAFTTAGVDQAKKTPHADADARRGADPEKQTR